MLPLCVLWENSIDSMIYMYIGKILHLGDMIFWMVVCMHMYKLGTLTSVGN